MSFAYDKVTNAIIEQMEKGIIPWVKNWKGEQAINYVTRKPYRGINTLLLPFPGEYLTFSQVNKAGGKVKKGEKANIICFFQFMEKEKDGEKETFPLLKYYNVFHIGQCEGIESKCEPFAASGHNEIQEEAEKIIADYTARTGLKYNVMKGSDRAYYSPKDDIVVMPEINQFSDSEGYYSVAFHELVHSTGHESRLGRFQRDKACAFGSETYSKEELVAEIGSAFINNHVGIDNESVFKNTVAYLQSWIRVLQNDKKMIVTASGQATKAANLILNIQNGQAEATA